jgi:hypothetical protein
MFTWATAGLGNVYSLGLKVDSNDVITRDTAALSIQDLPDWVMVSAAYGVDEGHYLIAYAHSRSGGVGTAALVRNASDTGFEVVDTPGGWAVAFVVEINQVMRTQWATATLLGGVITLGTHAEVSSTSRGQTLHPQVLFTPQGILIIFRYDSGTDGPARYEVRGRWVAGAKATSSDIVFASYANGISRVRATYTDSTVNLVWNIVHNYASGGERIVFLATPVEGSFGEPSLISSVDLIQQRPDISWSTSLNRFIITWIQKSTDAKWSAWVVAYASSLPPAQIPDDPAVETPVLDEKPVVTSTVLSGTRTVRNLASRSATLSRSHKASIRAFVRAHPNATSFRCTGCTASQKILKYHPALARARAKAVCGYISKLVPRATTSRSGKTPIGRLGAKNRKVIIQAYTNTTR